MLEVRKWKSNACVTIYDGLLEEVDCFKYLGSQEAADGGCKRDVIHRMNEGHTEKCAE